MPSAMILMMLIFAVLLLSFIAEVKGRKTTLPNGEILDVEDEYASVRDKDPELRKKKTLKQPQRLWRQAAVIYEIESSIGCPQSRDCKEIVRAMREYTANTCVRFKERSGEVDYVRFVGDPDIRGGGAHLGRVGGVQSIVMNIAYWRKDFVLHELGHALGLLDEIRHPDRDHYLDIYPENIEPDYLSAFDKVDRDSTNVLGEPFDRKSIMMYHNYAFHKVGAKLITIKAKSGHALHDNKKLSRGDIRRINDLYRCKGTSQKPSFPVDVVCTFKHNDCGFKWSQGRMWKWTPPHGDSINGYLISTLGPEVSKITRGHVWSVNFHGLSHLDNVRGPDGCINFVYLADFRGSGELLVRLFKVELDSPLVQRYSFKQTFEIWSISVESEPEIHHRKWTRVSISVNVLKPFALLFTSKFVDGTLGNSVKVKDLEVKYTPCEHPTDAGLMSDEPKFAWFRSLKDLFKSSKPSSSRFSRSSSLRSSLRSSSGSLSSGKSSSVYPFKEYPGPFMHFAEQTVWQKYKPSMKSLRKVFRKNCRR